MIFVIWEMPFLNFVGNKKKYWNLFDMNFFMKNRYFGPGSGSTFSKNLDPRIRIYYYVKVDPRIRIHFSQMWIPESGSGSTSKWDGSETLPNRLPDNIIPKACKAKCSESVVGRHNNNILPEEAEGQVELGRTCREPTAVDPEHDSLSLAGLKIRYINRNYAVP